MKPEQKRCAVYTRKSSDEGLDQAFNSLDAQREAGEAYVKSQASEGWRLLGARYDDGGFSGGSIERPALQRLLADISAGKVDVVVVYKIDRLTRSLADFARIVELFDKYNVSFVSVTQAFNTTSSMGRLTLNVLLSFAQFEREVTGERIRDKIAASKAKGMWMGGTLPLGYDLPLAGTRTLVVNTAEAEVVRLIFAQYLELGSVHALQRWLAANGIRSKLRTTRGGKLLGGQPFSRGALFHLLRNRTYLGLIVHKDQLHDGTHAAIVEPRLFEAVAAKLDANARRHLSRRDHVARAPLAGRIFDSDGQPMSPSFTHGKRGRVYRYYVSSSLLRGAHARRDDAVRRVAGPALEALVEACISRLLPAASGDGLQRLIRVEVHAEALQLLLPVRWLAAIRARLEGGETAGRDAEEPTRLRLVIPVRVRLRGGRTSITGRSASVYRRDPVLIKALRSAHFMVSSGRSGLPMLHTAPSSPYLRRLVRLAFLAPDLQAAILAGAQPPGLTLEQLMRSELPLAWDEQAGLLARLAA